MSRPFLFIALKWSRNWLLCLFMLLALSPAKAEQTIKVGAIIARTGEVTPGHVEFFHGTFLAVDRINAQGGLLGAPLELIVFDSTGTSLGSKKAAIDAVSADVVAVLGAIRSSYSLAAAPVLQKAGVPMISPTSTNPQVTLVGDYIFRVCYLDSFQAQVLADFSRNELKARHAVVLTNAGNKYSLGLAKDFIASFEKAGGTVLLEQDYLEGVTDYSDLAANTARIAPDLVFIPGYSMDSSMIIKELRAKGI